MESAPAVPAPVPPIVVQPHSGPNLLVRIAWFLLIGLWLGAVVSAVAWVLVVTVIGLPLGLWLLNRLPAVITLRPQEQRWRLEDGVLRQGQPQRPFWLRALYFLFIGWWFSAVWLAAAYACVVTVVLLPAAFWMYGRAGAVTTLYRS